MEALRSIRESSSTRSSLDLSRTQTQDSEAGRYRLSPEASSVASAMAKLAREQQQGLDEYLAVGAPAHALVSLFSAFLSVPVRLPES